MDKQRLLQELKVRLPREVFTSCVKCGCDSLQAIAEDVFCTKCDWNSMQFHIDAGGWDHLYELGFMASLQQALRREDNCQNNDSQIALAN